MRLKDKVAIVTGGAKGLGRAFALKMAEEGARVMVVTRKDMDNLKETVKRIEDIGGQAALFQADVSRETDTLAMARETADMFGRIDILVNNAAIYDGIKRKPFYEIDLAEWDLVMAVNVKGAFLAARAVFPYMKDQGYGKIINLASEVFFTGSQGFCPVCGIQRRNHWSYPGPGRGIGTLQYLHKLRGTRLHRHRGQQGFSRFK